MKRTVLIAALLLGAGMLVVSVAALVIDVEVGMFGFKEAALLETAATERAATKVSFQ